MNDLPIQSVFAPGPGSTWMAGYAFLNIPTGRGGVSNGKKGSEFPCGHKKESGREKPETGEGHGEVGKELAPSLRN